MPWWSWIVVGALLLGSELAFVDAQFYLVFLGAAALVVGALDLGGTALPVWGQWLLFAGLSLAAMVLFRRKLYVLLRPPARDMPIGPAGDSVVLPVELAPGAECRIEYRGSTWQARNGGDVALAAGARAKIARVDGLTLQLTNH